MEIARVPGLRQLPQLASRVKPDVVLFNSWWGKRADSPRAISEELLRRDAPYEQVWVLDDPGHAPEGASAVRPGSVEFLRQAGRARYIVSNNTLPGYFRKKPEQTYVQTWHGTPLKRVGFDIEYPSFAGGEAYIRRLGSEVAKWDFLVSPNRFSTDVLRKAFGYRGEVLETGYPRTDLLLSDDRERVRRLTRAELGVAEGVTAVLYAPTWRDDASFSTALDLSALCDLLGNGHVVMLRAHALVASTVRLPDHPRLVDVSGRDDIGELLLAADVLVTDYSSVMFDFACTRKPMVFFTYDMEHYRDELRGFYFDFTAEAPGPLVTTTGDLADALLEIDAVQARHASAYTRFCDRFCHLDDGHASARVVDAVFGPG
jgi:CDP-glycerol glycerophosphotransferase